MQNGDAASAMNESRFAMLLEKLGPLLAHSEPPGKWNFDDDEERRSAIETEAERRAEMVESIASIFRPAPPPQPAKPPEPVDLEEVAQAINRVAKSIQEFEWDGTQAPAPIPPRAHHSIAKVFGWAIGALLAAFVYLTEMHPSYLLDMLRAWQGH